MIDLDELPTVAAERLEQELVDTAARLWVGTARWIELLGEFDARELWRTWECVSTAAWVSWHCGVASQTARDQVRVARRLRDLPGTRAAFATGALSYSKVRALVRIATPESEAELIYLAVLMTANQLDVAVAETRRAMRVAEDGAALAAHQARTANWYIDDDGTHVITMRLAADEGAAVIAAVEAEAAELARLDRNVSAETPDTPIRTVGQRRADAFVNLITRPDEPAARPSVQVRVHVDAETVAGGDSGGKAGGWRIGDLSVSDHVGRMLACDAAVQAVIHGANGEVLDVGRTSHAPPPRLRAAMETRDGETCQTPGCDCKGSTRLHAHHIAHWTRDSGPTSLDNLVSVCPYHHRLIHQGFLTVTVNPDGTLRWTGRTSTILQTLSARMWNGDDWAGNQDGHLSSPRGLGGRLDLDATVSGMCSTLSAAR